MATLDDIIKTSALLDEQIQVVSAEALISYFAPIFEADERIHAVVWGQWAPYFNDGDPCVFGLNYEVPIRAAGYTSSPYGYDDHGLPTVDGEWDPLIPEMVDLCDRAVALLEALPLPFLKRITEDGVICVTRDKVTISDYDHD